MVGVLLVGALGSALGRGLGGLLATVLARLHLSLLDRAAGAVGGLVLAAVLVGAGLALLSTGPGPAGEWLATARASQLGSAATAVADQALTLVRTQAPGLPGGAR